MTAQLTERWQNLSERERYLIGSLLALLVAVILWLGLYQPLMNARERAENTLQAASRDAAEIEAAAALKASLGSSEQTTQSRPLIDEAGIRTVVAQTTQQEGLTLTRLQPDTSSGGLTVWFDDVNADRILTWVKVLNTDHGIRVDRASIQRSGEATVRAQFLLVPAGSGA